MLAALGNGVKGNKWFSLIDKVYRLSTLQAAWEQVKANRGAGGIDGQSIEGLAANAERYLNELAKDLEEGRYTPQAVRRVDIPKTGGISPLLVNLYLHSLDEIMLQRGYHMVRYADDFVILCKSAEQAHRAREEVKAWVEENGLTLHPDKTHMGDCRIEGQGKVTPVRSAASMSLLGGWSNPCGVSSGVLAARLVGNRLLSPCKHYWAMQCRLMDALPWSCKGMRIIYHIRKNPFIFIVMANCQHGCTSYH